MSHEVIKPPSGSPEKSSLKDKLKLSREQLSNMKSSLSVQKLPRLYNQLVIFIIDGSRSMKTQSINKIPKCQDIDINIRGVINRLRDSKNSLSFDVAVIAFSDHHTNCFGIKGVTEIESGFCFDPVKIIKEPKGTYLRAPLLETKAIIESYFKKYKDKNNSALILLMTDGILDDYNTSLEAAKEIKGIENVTISVAYLEDEISENSKWHTWNEKTGEMDESVEVSHEDVRKGRIKVSEKLSVFASENAFYVKTIDPEKIRKHMINSISLTSKAII
jgi:uncharacterized protein YegL